MKKAILGLLLLGAAYHLKGQQVTPVNPPDTLLNKLLIKPVPFQPFKPLDKINLNKVPVAISSVDHMPVAVLVGNSKMPVKKLGGYYTMPVAGKKPVPPPLLKTP